MDVVEVDDAVGWHSICGRRQIHFGYQASAGTRQGRHDHRTNSTGDRIASQYQGATSDIQGAAIAYLAVILLVIALVVNVSARVIVATSVRRAAR